MPYKKMKPWVRFVRPKALLWFGISTCLGFAAIILQEIPPLDFPLLIGLIILTNAASIFVNDIGDIDSDAQSVEKSRLNRPLVTGEISIRTAAIVAIVLYAIALIGAWSFKLSAFIYILTIILFGVTYSLPPLKFNGRTYASQVYWVVLCFACYFLLVSYFEEINVPFIQALIGGEVRTDFLAHGGALYSAKPALIFFAGIIFFMGIAEILAKDLRDMKNDLAGGRNTFVNKIGVRLSAILTIPFAAIGTGLWVYALHLSDVFFASPFPWICAAVGVAWIVQVWRFCQKLAKEYHQPHAASLHSNWATTYLAMQVCTFFSFV